MKQNSEHRNQTGMLATGKRRRFAAWLLLGWASFWLTTVYAQTCCSELAAGSQNSSSHVQQIVASSADHATGTSPENSDCPEAAVPDIVPPPAAVAAVFSPEPSFDIPLPSAAVPVTARANHSAKSHWLPPPATLPVYLRHQRFLI